MTHYLSTSSELNLAKHKEHASTEPPLAMVPSNSSDDLSLPPDMGISLSRFVTRSRPHRQGGKDQAIQRTSGVAKLLLSRCWDEPYTSHATWNSRISAIYFEAQKISSFDKRISIIVPGSESTEAKPQHIHQANFHSQNIMSEWCKLQPHLQSRR